MKTYIWDLQSRNKLIYNGNILMEKMNNKINITKTIEKYGYDPNFLKPNSFLELYELFL